ncbi:MAG TPA: histidine kinase dimerization/phospho-acceptor domain-containing protein [Thermoanaerobaculia bacterium]|nr:histidine kinase dimerization/phospho-acceptor domain-containing protein [Thermoanaerobaculia bacterium]
MDPWLETFARANFQRSADTAHDLKTPLNVAVLNLELLRMRLRKLDAAEDEKVSAYTAAIETELRRLGRIFDAFFLLSTPPKNEGGPVAVEVAQIAAGAAGAAGFTLETSGNASVPAHEARIRQLFKLFFEGASKLFADRQAEAALDASCFTVTILGRTEDPDFEVTKVFKFYYSDAEGVPDLSLAVARLIAETYGGEINAVRERDKVVLRLSLPLGAR